MSIVKEVMKLIDSTSRGENNQLILPGANKQGYPIRVQMISRCVDTNATLLDIAVATAYRN